MKYFVKGWYEDNSKAEKIIREYNNYYKSIEAKLSASMKNMLKGRHDTHIIRTYFKENNYIMELEERIWGKANIVFCNATLKDNSNIKDEYWLYDEIYPILDKIEINILLNKSEIAVVCSDAYININDKDYFKTLYIKEDFNIDLADNNKNHIANTVIDKENMCGSIMLKSWEELVYSFIQIYSHIKYYKYNNIEDKLVYHYYNLSSEDKKNMYKILFSDLEKSLIKSIKILQQYQAVIKEKELDNIINKFLGIYNQNDISMQRKNELYLNLDKKITCNLNNLYKRILECIDTNIIKQ